MQVTVDQEDWIKGVEGAQGHWWDPSLAVALYRHASSGQVLVSVTAATPSGECADVAPRHWLLYELKGKELVRKKTHTNEPTILQVLDLNGDGRLEIVTKQDFGGEDFSLHSPDEGGPAAALTYSFQDCPC